MTAELRCPRTLHAVLTEDGMIEIKCRHDKCGATSGVTVLHQFNPSTGELVRTRRFRNPSIVFDQNKERT